MSGETQAAFGQNFLVLAIELVTMPVTFADFGYSVSLSRQAAVGQQARISTQAHGAAQLVDAFELAQLVNDAIGGGRIALGGIGVLEATDVAREFDHRRLHAETDSEIRYFPLARVADGRDHAFHAPLAESAGNQDAVELVEIGRTFRPMHVLGFNPMDVHFQPVRKPAMQQRFLQALVGIFVLDVFSHQADVDFVLRILHPLQHPGPTAQIARMGVVHAQQAQQNLIHALFGEHQGHFVDRENIGGSDDGFHVHVAEQRDLLLHIVRERTLRAAQQHVRLNTEGAQLLDTVLRRFSFQLLRRCDPRHQRDVHESGVVAAQLMPELADGFQERQRFNIAHRAANLHDHHIYVGRHFTRSSFDLIRHVRNHLHRLAQVIPAAFAMDDLLVDSSGRQIIALAELGVGEALVMAKIQICFSAVVSDVHFAVLERAHGAGIDVQIRIELLQRHPQSAAFEQTADGRGRNAFAKRRNHAPGYKNVLGRWHPHLYCFNKEGSKRAVTRSRSSGVSTPSDS